MNEALDFYKEEEKVWHVSGWNYLLDTDGLDDVFLWRTMNCWGWATWDDKWKYYEKDVDKTISEFTQKDIQRFNLDTSEDFFGQVIANKEKKINTWAIFWYVSIFKQEGLCLNPVQTFVENIGHDGSGVHCGKNERFISSLSSNKNINFVTGTGENKVVLKRIGNFYKSQKKSFIARIINKLSRMIYGKNII